MSPLVERFLAHVDEGAQDWQTVDAVAYAINTHARTLQIHCRRDLGTSPARYMRQRRLDAARADLLAATDVTTVTRAAVAHGFGEFGRFARYYRAAFGELPSATLRAARGAARG